MKEGLKDQTRKFIDLTFCNQKQNWQNKEESLDGHSVVSS